MAKKVRMRMCLFPTDIMDLTGKSYKAVLVLMQNIRKTYNKPQKAFISIEEFCTYTGLNEEEVRQNLG
ncbi:MAG: hypothetical protein LBI72_00775 [Flavobacteriaceae bacterium]|jgi:hypothetical protein|nr:hypothetical protein [Flavobacteriaceae bacterium]